MLSHFSSFPPFLPHPLPPSPSVGKKADGTESRVDETPRLGGPSMRQDAAVRMAAQVSLAIQRTVDDYAPLGESLHRSLTGEGMEDIEAAAVDIDFKDRSGAVGTTVICHAVEGGTFHRQISVGRPASVAANEGVDDLEATAVGVDLENGAAIGGSALANSSCRRASNRLR